MAGQQTQRDKELFFADLERVGESGDEKSGAVHCGLSSDDDEVKIVKVLKVTSRTTSLKDKNKRERRIAANVKDPPRVKIPAATKTQDLQFLGATSKGELAEKRRPSARKAGYSRRNKSKPDIELLPDGQRLFDSCTFSKPRKTRIRTSISHGAIWARAFDSAVTHVIVDHHLDMKEASKALPKNWSPSDAIFVRDTWLIDSIRYKQVQDHLQSRFWVKKACKTIEQGKKPLPTEIINKASSSSRLKRKFAEAAQPQSDATTCNTSAELDIIMEQMKEIEQLPTESDFSESASFASTIPETSSEDSSDENQFESLRRQKKNARSQCMEKNDGSQSNPNSKTIDILRKMATYYDRTGDHWRTIAYRKAVTALQKQIVHITTKEQAVAIPHIGERLADKIEEIVTTNTLKKLNSTVEDLIDRALQLFMGIYGVGIAQANLWIAQGHRTLEDLTDKASLNTNQKIGIEHYEDFQQRIPRAEVTEHGQIVQKALQDADPQFDAIIGGSYRRGNPDSGDIDILITKRDADIQLIRCLMTDTVIPYLTQTGYLKAALATSSKHDQGSKWHGASCLPGRTTWRRLDLLYVPWSEFGAALIYFTGNDIFNRSLRLLASKKGMRLNQHGLYADVLRGKGRQRVNDSQLLEGHSEKKIFDILGVPWRPPQHRKC